MERAKSKKRRNKNVHVPKMQQNTSDIFFKFCPFVPLFFCLIGGLINLISGLFGLIGGLIGQIGGLISLIGGLISG